MAEPGKSGGAVDRRESLWEEFIVCHAAGYPDPYKPTPNTLEEARRFAREHTTERFPSPVIRRRVVSDWETVADA